MRRQAAEALASGRLAHLEASLVLEPTGSVLSRAQVVAETLEAIRVGAISRGERSVLPTAAQLESIRLAGQRAVAADATRMASR